MIGNSNNCALKYTLYGQSESQSSAQARSRYYAGTLSQLQQAHDRVLNPPYISATVPGLVHNNRARYEEEKDGYRSHTSQDKQSMDLDPPQTKDSTPHRSVTARILRRKRAIHELNVLRCCIKAIMSFQKLVTMLRKREEEELRAFRTVHFRVESTQTVKEPAERQKSTEGDASERLEALLDAFHSKWKESENDNYTSFGPALRNYYNPDQWQMVRATTESSSPEA